MSSASFPKLIKALKREALELKNTHRRSTLTVETITKSIQVTVTATTDWRGLALVPNEPVVGVKFNTPDPQLLMVTFDSADAASPFGINYTDISTDDDGEYYVLLWIAAAYNQNPHTTYTATFNVNITSTGDFTLRVVRNGSD